MPEVWSISICVTRKVIMNYLLNFYWSLGWSSFFFTSFFVPVGNVIAVVHKRIRRCEVDWLKPAGQTARDLDWLITLPSLVTFSKFLAVRKRPSMKPDNSVVLSLIVHIHFSEWGTPPPAQAPKGMVRKELIIRLAHRRAHNAAIKNQRITGEHDLLKGQPSLPQQIFIHFFSMPNFLRDQILEFMRLNEIHTTSASD